MRWSPNLAFGNDTYARNAKEAERITNADLMRSTAVVGSAEGTSASFFPYFDEHQNMVADMVQYKFCVQERSARL